MEQVKQGGRGVQSHTSLGRTRNMDILNCTIYNCEIGIYGHNWTGGRIFGNIFDSCPTGIEWQSDNDLVKLDYNNFNNCTTDVINVSKGTNTTSLDPQFVDASNGNFIIGNSSLKGTGFKPYFNNTSVSYLDAGAVQRQEITPSYASVGDVREGVDRGDGEIGTLDLPSVNDVEKGVDFDNATKTGTFKKPEITDVRDGIQYGANDTEFEGNLDLPSENDVRKDVDFDNSTKTGNCYVPSKQDVEEGVNVDVSDTGEFAVPSILDVRENTKYGYNEEFSGTLIAGNEFVCPISVTAEPDGEINVSVEVD